MTSSDSSFWDTVTPETSPFTIDSDPERIVSVLGFRKTRTQGGATNKWNDTILVESCLSPFSIPLTDDLHMFISSSMSDQL